MVVPVKGDNMRTVQLLLLSTIFFFAATAAGYAADVAKIGVVDFQKILTTSTAGKKAQIEINAKGKNMEQELKTKGDAINKQKETFEREALVMSKPMREQQERELRILINDFKSMQKTYMNDFKQFERRLVSRIRDEILTLVTEKAKKEGVSDGGRKT